MSCFSNETQIISSSSMIISSVSVIINFDSNIENMTELKNEIATILGISVNEIQVILISSTQVQVIINGQSPTVVQQSANQLIQIVNNGNFGSGSSFNLLRNAIDAYFKREGDNTNPSQFSLANKKIHFHFLVLTSMLFASFF